MADKLPYLEIGTILFDNYTVVETLGNGQYGSVYKAINKNTN